MGSMLALLSTISFFQWMLGIVLLCISFYWILRAPFRQFSSLPQQTPHWLFGNTTFGSNVESLIKFYNDMKHHRFSLYWVGSTPSIMMTDLDLVKKVQIVDFEHFTDFGFMTDDYIEMNGGIFGMADAKGEEWRILKRHLTPAFSGPRIRKTVHGMNICATKMTQHLEDVKEKSGNVDLQDAVQKFALTTIAAVAFGVDIDCFKDSNNEFMKHGMNLFVDWKFLLLQLFPKTAVWLRLKVINPKAKNFFMALAERLINQRKNSTAENNDILDNMIKVSKECSLMTDDMTFQTIVQFFGDGVFTYSEAMTGVIWFLAMYPDVQDRLVEELETNLEGKQDISHEDIGNLPYMDQVINEGMRLSSFPFTMRQCTKEYTIPNSEFTIPKGMKVIIPIAGLHHDPEYWPNPETFDPDRFSPENKSSLQTGSFQPFGNGPRNCLGSNLMKMEAKVMLGHLLRKFRVVPTGDICHKIVYDKYKLMAIEGVNKVNIVRRD